MTLIEQIRGHDHDVYYCESCRATYAPGEVGAIREDGMADCPACGGAMDAAAHLEACG